MTTYTIRSEHRGQAFLVAGGARSTSIDDLLDAAGDAVNADFDYARAWSLLLRVDWSDLLTASAFRDYAQENFNRRRWHELQPLFALIAVENPGLVCDLFPTAAGPLVLALCGEEGLRVALHELQSRDHNRRTEAAFALAAFAEAKLVAIPLEPIREACGREWDEDVQVTLRQLLDAIEAAQVEPAAVTA